MVRWLAPVPKRHTGAGRAASTPGWFPASAVAQAAAWTIEADPGRVRRSRNDEPADPPLLAPIDDRVRYTLGLPDLLASENQPLAQAIFKESTGGFDLSGLLGGK